MRLPTAKRSTIDFPRRWTPSRPGWETTVAVPSSTTYGRSSTTQSFGDSSTPSISPNYSTNTSVMAPWPPQSNGNHRAMFRVETNRWAFPFSAQFMVAQYPPTILCLILRLDLPRESARFPWVKFSHGVQPPNSVCLLPLESLSSSWQRFRR